jgi:hypothetical protein
MGEMRNAHKILFKNPEGKRPLGHSKFRWEDNIKMDLKERGYKCVSTEFIWLILGAVVGSCKHLGSIRGRKSD